MLTEQQISVAYKGFLLLLVAIYFGKRKLKNNDSPGNIGRLFSHEREVDAQGKSSPRATKSVQEILKALGYIILAGAALLALITVIIRIRG